MGVRRRQEPQPSAQARASARASHGPCHLLRGLAAALDPSPVSAVHTLRLFHQHTVRAPVLKTPSLALHPLAAPPCLLPRVRFFKRVVGCACLRPPTPPGCFLRQPFKSPLTEVTNDPGCQIQGSIFMFSPSVALSLLESPSAWPAASTALLPRDRLLSVGLPFCPSSSCSRETLDTPGPHPCPPPSPHLPLSQPRVVSTPGTALSPQLPRPETWDHRGPSVSGPMPSPPAGPLDFPSGQTQNPAAPAAPAAAAPSCLRTATDTSSSPPPPALPVVCSHGPESLLQC